MFNSNKISQVFTSFDSDFEYVDNINISQLECFLGAIIWIILGELGSIFYSVFEFVRGGTGKIGCDLVWVERWVLNELNLCVFYIIFEVWGDSLL